MTYLERLTFVIGNAINSASHKYLVENRNENFKTSFPRVGFIFSTLIQNALSGYVYFFENCYTISQHWIISANYASNVIIIIFSDNAKWVLLLAVLSHIFQVMEVEVKI